VIIANYFFSYGLG